MELLLQLVTATVVMALIAAFGALVAKLVLWIVERLDERRRNRERAWLERERKFGPEMARKMRYHIDGYRCGDCAGCRQEEMWVWRRRFRAEMDSILVFTLRDDYLRFLVMIGVSSAVWESAYNWSLEWPAWAGGICDH